MKRLILPLLAALALPTAVNAEEFTEIKPKNFYSYKKSSLVRQKINGERFISFLGTTKYADCFHNQQTFCMERIADPQFNKLWDESVQNLVYKYEINCDTQFFNKEGDFLKWSNSYIDPIAFGVAQKYCPMEEWTKLPNK